MKTSTRNLVIVASCIVVLGGAVAALSLTGGQSQTETPSSSSTPTMDLVSKKSSDIVSMTVKNKKGGYTLIPHVEKTKASSTASSSGSSTASSESETITYTVQGLDNVPIDSYAAESVIRNGFSLVATQNLGTVSNPEEFGLKDPQATVEVKFKDGSSYNYKIGSVCATDSSSYYMAGENSNNVYVVSVDSGILEDETYFISKDVLSIQNGDKDNEFTLIKLSGKNYPQPIIIQKSDTKDRITSPINADVDSNKYSTLTGALATVNAKSVVKVNPTEADLKTYGLDQPSAIVEYTVNKENHKIMLGAKKDSNYYFMVDQTKVVYSILAESVSSWAQTDAFSMRSKLIYLPNIETVKSISFTQNGSTTALNVERTKDESKSTEDKAQYTYKVMANAGKSIDYENDYKKFYQELISIELLEQNSTKPTGTPNYAVEYHYFDKTSTDKIEFFKNGDRRYTVVMNGEVIGNITSPDLDKVMYDYRQLAGIK